MTQAFNLALLANAVDTSGRLNVGTNATGTLPVANGGTGTTTPSLVAGTNISITGSWPNQTINNTSTASGTVTSVATGNGLQGGTITTTGTLSIAAPGYNTVGSYCMLYFWGNNAANPSANGTYSGGSSGATNQVWAGYVEQYDYNCAAYWRGQTYTAGLSGTWRWMASSGSGGRNCLGMGVRVT